MLNGSPRASTGLLRSVMEMLMLHCWWQERISRKGSSEQFYDWLEGRRAKPKFRDVVAITSTGSEFLRGRRDGACAAHL